MSNIQDSQGQGNPGDATGDHQTEIAGVGICPVPSNGSTSQSTASTASYHGVIAADEVAVPTPGADEEGPIREITPCRPLHPNHLADLRSSGLSDATIQAAGVYSETDLARLTRFLGWNVPRKMSPSLVFPYVGIDGSNGYCRVKPDDPRTCQGKPVKYESPKGRTNQVYLPPGTRCRLDEPEYGLARHGR